MELMHYPTYVQVSLTFKYHHETGTIPPMEEKELLREYLNLYPGFAETYVLCKLFREIGLFASPQLMETWLETILPESKNLYITIVSQFYQWVKSTSVSRETI